MNNVNKDTEFKPYERCLGRKFGRNRRKLRKLNRPLAVIFRTKICENAKVFSQKRKYSCLQQIFRSFYKDALGFRVDSLSRSFEKCSIQDGDFIRLISHVSKAVIRKFLLRLNYELDDYKLLRRRIYTLLFEFYICNTVLDNDHKNITIDIHARINDMFVFVITVSQYYSIDLIQFLFTYFVEERDGRPI
jgi:hypothetical protein